MLKAQSERKVAEETAASGAQQEQSAGVGGMLGDLLGGGSKRHGMVEALAKSVARLIGSEIGWRVIRGVLGSTFGGATRRR